MSEVCKCDHSSEIERMKLVISQMKNSSEQHQSQLKTVINEADSRISKLCQDKYTLELKVDHQLKQIMTLQEDMDNSQKDAEKEKEKAIKELTRKFNESIERQKNELKMMSDELEKSRISEADLVAEVQHLKDQINDMKKQLNYNVTLTPSPSTGSENTDIITSLEHEKQALCNRNNKLQDKIDDLSAELTTMKYQLKNKDGEIGQLACETTSLYNEKEKLLERIKDLKVELDVATMQSDRNLARGNSLFAEVEDRRVEVEKQLIDLRVENDSLKTQLRLSREAYNQIKMQLSALWDIQSADEYKRRYEKVNMEMLYLAEENQTLVSTIKQLERNMIRIEKLDEVSEVAEARKYQILYEFKEKEANNLAVELQRKRMMLMTREDALRKIESELHNTKLQLISTQSSKEKLEFKCDELVTKYEPETIKNHKKPKQEFVVEKLNFPSRKKFKTNDATTSSDKAPLSTTASRMTSTIATTSTTIDKSSASLTGPQKLPPNEEGQQLQSQITNSNEVNRLNENGAMVNDIDSTTNRKGISSSHDNLGNTNVNTSVINNKTAIKPIIKKGEACITTNNSPATTYIATVPVDTPTNTDAASTSMNGKKHGSIPRLTALKSLNKENIVIANIPVSVDPIVASTNVTVTAASNMGGNILTSQESKMNNSETANLHDELNIASKHRGDDDNDEVFIKSYLNDNDPDIQQFNQDNQHTEMLHDDNTPTTTATLAKKIIKKVNFSSETKNHDDDDKLRNLSPALEPPVLHLSDNNNGNLGKEENVVDHCKTQ